MGIYHDLKKAAKGVYKAATTPTVVVVEKPQPTRTVYVERATPPPTRTVYVERHTAPTPPPPPVRTVYVSTEPVETRAFKKLAKIEMLSHYHSYSDEYDYDTWDALKRFGRALTNIYADGYCHRIAVSVSSDELTYIRQLINSLYAPVVPNSHSAYRNLAQEFLSTYRAYL